MSARAILRMKFAPAAVAMLAAVLVIGCGGDNGTGGGTNAKQLAIEGWNLFVTGEYSAAIDKFSQADALGGDVGTLQSVYNGLGWSYARLGDLDMARDDFIRVSDELAIHTNIDTNAGLSIVYLALKEYELATRFASDALSDSNGHYDFRYDPSVTEVTLRLARAIARFHQGLYEPAAADVVLLGGPALNHNAPDFVAQLLEAIQNLREDYGQGLLTS
jgi:tetratricopeptide (TPR) repeat protein